MLVPCCAARCLLNREFFEYRSQRGLRTVYHKGSLARPIAAKMLCRYAGLTQREVADVFEIKTGAAVSTQLKRLKEAAAYRPDVAPLLKRTDRRVRQLLRSTFKF